MCAADEGAMARDVRRCVVIRDIGQDAQEGRSADGRTSISTGRTTSSASSLAGQAVQQEARNVPWQNYGRIGEAANPGPQARAATIMMANLTSAGTGWPIIRDLDWTVGLFQETRQREACEAKAEARSRGWVVQAGPLEATGKDLVWTVVKTGALTAMPITMGARMVGVVWSPGGPSALRVYNLYGLAERSQSARTLTSELLRACLEDAEAHGQCPALIGGDINMEFEEVDCVAEFAVSGWTDLGSEPTCATGSAKQPRRVDVLLANPQLQDRAGAVATDWYTGLSVHAVQTFAVDLGAAPQVLLWRAARFHMDAAKKSKAEAWEEAKQLLPDLQPGLDSADPDKYFGALERLISAFHTARAGKEADLVGRTGEAVWGRREPRQHEGTAETAATAGLGRRLRRLEELVRLWPPCGPLQAHASALLDALRRTERRKSAWRRCMDACTTREVAAGMVAEAQSEYAAARAGNREARRERWRGWCRDMIRTQPGRVWTWVREGPRPTNLPTAQHQADEEARGQEARQLNDVDEWWWKMWGSTEEPDWQEASVYLQTYDTFGEYPEQRQWTGAAVQAIVARMGNKAPGADGRVAAEMKDWAPYLYELVAGLFNVVERAGRWPQALRRSLVAMLAKRGTGAKDDFRPITLLSVLYRAWARGHSEAMRSWLRANGVARQQDLAGADVQAYETAMQLAWSRRTGETMSGVAIDWTKCYDMVALSLIPRVAQAAGVPPAVWRPVHDMYGAPRSILLAGAMGKTATPTKGIPAGCPLAGEWLALTAHMLVAGMRAIGPQVVPRPYVDDLTAAVWGREGAAEHVQRVWSIVGHFGMVFRWVAAPTKCARFSTARAVRAELAATEGPPVQDAFLDLGVMQRTTGARDAGNAAERDLRAFKKMARMRALKLNFDWRCRMVASSGLPTALYGAECHPVSEERLKELRRAAFGAIWRSGNRAASEVVLSILSPWRADPGAIAITQPFRQLQRALAGGLMTTAQLDELMEAGDTVGPIAALGSALARIEGVYLGQGRIRTGDRTLDLRETPPTQLQLTLVDRHRQKQMEQVSRRRASHAGFQYGVDMAVSLQLQRTRALSPGDEACLRLLQAGGATTQDLAAKKFRTVSSMCPHCGLAPETVEHRLHHCPRWAARRIKALGGRCWREVRRVVPQQTLLTGLMPIDMDLLAAAREAERAARWPAPQRLEGTVWSDGSALHPHDPLMTRAGWAVVAKVDGVLREIAGGAVPGRQTSGRAELCALVWTSQCTGDFTLVTDNQGVLRGAQRWNGAAPPDLADGKNGDLWRMMERPVSARWIKAHKSQQEAIDMGFSLEDHAGNSKADEAAGRWAEAGDLPPETRKRREEAREAVLCYQTVIAAVQAASMDTPHARHHRAKGRKSYIAKPGRRRAAAPPPQPPPVALAPRPTALHDLRIVPGPLPAPEAETKRSLVRHFPWQIGCARCGRKATNTAGWCNLANSLCLADPEARHCTTAKSRHLVRPCPGGWECQRCGLTGPRKRQAAASRATCLVKTFCDPTGAPIRGADSWARHQYELSKAWRRWRVTASRSELLEAPEQRTGMLAPQPAAAVRLRLVWTPHWTLRIGGRELCVRCGCGPHKAGGPTLDSTPCPGLRPLKAAAMVAVKAGAFGKALRDAPVAWREKVARDLSAPF